MDSQCVSTLLLLVLCLHRELRLHFLEVVELSHSREDPERSWSSSHDWLEVPEAIPELALTRSPSVTLVIHIFAVADDRLSVFCTPELFQTLVGKEMLVRMAEDE